MNAHRASDAADSSRSQVSENGISRRDTLTVAAAGLTAAAPAKIIKNVKYVELKGASHGLTWTRADEINAQLVPFLA